MSLTILEIAAILYILFTFFHLVYSLITRGFPFSQHNSYMFGPISVFSDELIPFSLMILQAVSVFVLVVSIKKNISFKVNNIIGIKFTATMLFINASFCWLSLLIQIVATLIYNDMGYAVVPDVFVRILWFIPGLSGFNMPGLPSEILYVLLIPVLILFGISLMRFKREITESI